MQGSDNKILHLTQKILGRCLRGTIQRRRAPVVERRPNPVIERRVGSWATRHRGVPWILHPTKVLT